MDYLHPSAAEAADRVAGALVSRVRAHPGPTRPADFPTERPIALELTDGDILGELERSDVDAAGRTVGRFFFHEGLEYGLAEEDHVELRRVADSLGKGKNVRAVATAGWLEEALFHWCRNRFRRTEARPFSAVLQERLAKDVRPHTAWFPVAELEVEAAFAFGPVVIQPITRAMMDAYEARLAAATGDPDAAARGLERLRRIAQGRAAVVVSLTAVGEKVVEEGLELAEAAVRLLTFFAHGSLSPWTVNTCAPAGAEYLPRALVFLEDADGLRHRSWIRTPSGPWRLGAAEVRELGPMLEALGALVRDEELNDFQARLRMAILTFCRAGATQDVNDRLVYTFSALEGLLLKDGQEPIQQNLGERMAFLNRVDPAERQQVLRTVRAAYKLRSQYVHHSVRVEEGEVLEAFVLLAWTTLYTALQNFNRAKTALAFIDAIDAVKFGARRGS